MKVSVYMSPADNEIIKAYAAYKHRSVSEFLLAMGMAEINRHIQKFDFKAAVKEIVLEMQNERFPAAANVWGGRLNND